MVWRRVILFTAVLAAIAAFAAQAQPESFTFAILGDRTGEVQPGVFEAVLREASAEKPAFLLTVGDLIQGGSDSTADVEWRQVHAILDSYNRFPLYLTPGNHDIWSARSEKLFEANAHHPRNYGFDYRHAHFTILDNSRSADLPAEELAFLEKDLREHAAQPVKFVVFHQPSWLVSAALHNPDFPLHQLAKKYGVQYVLSGHVHQMIRVPLEQVSYICVPSSGGHLRGAAEYEDGWFFGYGMVEVRGTSIDLKIKELNAPFGRGRVTGAGAWGMLGLLQKTATPSAKTH